MSEAAQVIEEVIEIAPQPGPQTDFLSSLADIVFYGGQAGGGKSYGLIIEPLRHYENRLFGGVVFRRNGVDIRNEGGLWDESEKVYSPIGGHPREAFMEWIFPSGARMKFAHLEHEKTVLNWQGAQIPYIGFDELTHFTEKQFIYMLSRNRSTTGIAAYIRGTCNPDVDSWVRKWIAWWIGEDGFAIPERSGIIRYFVRINDEMIWGDTKEELEATYGADCHPKSFTFIPAKLEDNQILLQSDPTYRSNLAALQRVDRERLQKGNWNVRAEAGMFFQKGWFTEIPVMYADDQVRRRIRSWDRAATKPSETNPDPDWTAGVRIAQLHDGRYVIEDVICVQDTPLGIERLIKNTAVQDGTEVEIIGQQDPGSAGVSEVGNFTRMLAGFVVHVEKTTTDKETRAKPVSAQCEHGNVLILQGEWNDGFYKEAESFPTKGVHDDRVDALSVGFNKLALDSTSFDNL